MAENPWLAGLKAEHGDDAGELWGFVDLADSSGNPAMRPSRPWAWIWASRLNPLGTPLGTTSSSFSVRQSRMEPCWKPEEGVEPRWRVLKPSSIPSSSTSWP